MPHFRVDDALHSHPKARKAGDEALGLWVRAGTYSMAYGTDGFVPQWWVKQQPRGITKARALVAAELWHADERDGEHGWRFHQWRQDSKAKIEADREKWKRQKATQRGGLSPPMSTVDKQVDSTQDSTHVSTPVDIGESPGYTQPNPKDNSGYLNPPPRQSNARANSGGGNALVKWDQRTNSTARSVDAYRIAEAFNASLSVPVETGVLTEIGVQIDKCLRSEIPPQAIAIGLRDWTASDSWSPTQIPRFVHKANNRSSINGKPTAKALGYDQALTQLLAEVETL